MEEYQKKVPKYEIHNPNFDAYFDEQCSKIEHAHLRLLPKELKVKLYRGDNLTAHRLTFLEKIYVLNALFGSECAIVVSSKSLTDGLSGGQLFDEALRVQEKELSMQGLAEEIIKSGRFVLGDKDLMEAVAITRFVCVSDIYRRVIPKAKKKKVSSQYESDYQGQREAFKAVVRMFYRYEAGKRIVLSDHGLNPSEWYALVHFYFGERSGSSFYEDAFASVFNANKGTLKKALTRMANEEYLLTRGRTQKKMYRLAPKGERIVVEVFDRIVFK